MAYLKSFFNFYLNASIHVALSMYSFVKITEIYFGTPRDNILDFFLFFGTLTGYNFVKYAGIAKLHHGSLTKNLKLIQVFSFICFLFLCFFALQIDLKNIWILAPLALLTLLYAIPFLSGFQKSLRTVSYLKVIIVAIVWSGTTVLLPIYNADYPINIAVLFMFLQRFLLVLVLILPFDIRDMQYDAISLQTIPRKIGVANTKKLGFVILMVCLLLEFFITDKPLEKRVFFIVFMIILVFLMRAKQEQSNYYSSFWVEAIPICWYLLLLF